MSNPEADSRNDIKSARQLPCDFFETIACPVCRSVSFRSILAVRYRDLKQKPSLDYSPIGVGPDTRLSVKECKTCRFVFVNPRLRAQYEELLYNDCKKKMYQTKFHLTDLETPKNAVSRRTRTVKHIGSLLACLSQIRSTDGAFLTLLDYGCGFGYTMSLARALGLKAYGVEVDRRRLKVCQSLGFKVAQPAAFDAMYPGLKVDIIICESCIEHVLDLNALMDFLLLRSRPGTVLFVSGLTPRVISIEKRRGEFVKSHFLEHVNFFQIPTLDHFMSKHGFYPGHLARWGSVVRLTDAVKLVGSYVLLNKLGQNPFRGTFERIFIYKD